MVFANTAPSLFQRAAYRNGSGSFDRFLEAAVQANARPANSVVQDEKSYTLVFDTPGVTREHLGIGIEGNVIRVQSKEGAPRRYSVAYELPTDIDVSSSEAKLENGVLTIKLAKLAPVSKVSELQIN
ncbi:MAG: Hsp20/alpha crystallin family protein [Burkholderiaceae bacterium]